MLKCSMPKLSMIFVFEISFVFISE